MEINLADLWFVVDSNDISSLPEQAYTSKGEAEKAAAKLSKDTEELRARIMPSASKPSVKSFDDVWYLVRDNITFDARNEEALF